MRAEAVTARLIEVPLELLDDGTNVRSPKRRGGQLGQADMGLAGSIAELGVLQPITVVERGDRFEVLYGHRRTAAARRAGLAAIPAIVEDEPSEKPIRQLVENQHRLPVNPIDIARTLRDYLEQHPETKQADLAAMLGRSSYWISTKLALLEMNPDTQEAVAAGRLDQGSAYAAHKATTSQRRGRARIFRIDADHLDHEAGQSASVVVPLPGGSATGNKGEPKATISVERGDTASIELVLGRCRARRDAHAHPRFGAPPRTPPHAGVPGDGRSAGIGGQLMGRPRTTEAIERNPTLSAAIFAARELAWQSHVNLYAVADTWLDLIAEELHRRQRHAETPIG